MVQYPRILGMLFCYLQSRLGLIWLASSLLHNQGAVAGIFITVGLAVAALIIGIFFFIRHRRRHAARKRWLAGMQQQRPSSFQNDPFQDPHDGDLRNRPLMRTIESDRYQDEARYEYRNTSPLVDVPLSHDRRSLGNGQGATIVPGPHPTMTPSDSEDHHPQNAVGYAYGKDANKHGRRGSYAPSSPSLYPASLPAEEEDHEVDDAVGNLKHQDLHVVTVPPRPPRSHLRNSSKGFAEYTPMTPPGSVSSSSQIYSAKTPSPISETRPQDVFTRRTLLDVRISFYRYRFHPSDSTF